MEIPFVSKFIKSRSIKNFDMSRMPIIIRNEVKEKENAKEGKALIAKKSEFLFGEIDDKEQDIRLIDMFFNAYHNFPIVAASIDSKVEQVVQDFRIEGPQKDALMKWAELIKLKHHMRRFCKNGLIAGTYWSEMVDLNGASKKGLGRLRRAVTFKHLDPRTMSIFRTKKGKILAHVQEINNERKYWGVKPKGILAKKAGNIEDMFCWRWNLIGSNKYGTSMILSSLPMLDVKDRIESDMKVIVKRYIAPIIHAKIGDDLHPADEDQVKGIQSKLSDIYSDTEYVTNHLVEMSVLDFKNKGLDIKPILTHIDSNILVGLQTQSLLLAAQLGDANVNDKGAEVKLRANGRHIRAIQDELKQAIEEQIFTLLTGNNKNKLIWERVEERQFQMDVEILRGLVADGIITQKKANSMLPDQFHDPDVENRELYKPGFGSQQLGPDKIKDNPNDPTKSTNTPNKVRVDKSQVDVKPAKKKPQKVEGRKMI